MAQKFVAAAPDLKTFWHTDPHHTRTTNPLQAEAASTNAPAQLAVLQSRLQACYSQPLDFSSPPPYHEAKLPEQPCEAPCGSAVDLSVNTSSRPRSISSSSSSSSGSGRGSNMAAEMLASLLQGSDPPSMLSAPPLHVVPQLATSLFKKSTSSMRPFKAYPKDPLSLPLGLSGVGSSPVETVLNAASNEAYALFRQQMLSHVAHAKSRRIDSPICDEQVNLKLDLSVSSQQPSQGSSQGTPQGGGATTQPEEAGSPQQPSSSACSSQEASTPPGLHNFRDPGYWERRRKNNEAAKRSRDARRAKEDEIAIRAAFLEQENLKLKYEVAALRSETTRLRCLLHSN